MPDVEGRLDKLEHRIGELEDINAIRRLPWAYGYYIDFNRAEPAGCSDTFRPSRFGALLTQQEVM